MDCAHCMHKGALHPHDELDRTRTLSEEACDTLRKEHPRMPTLRSNTQLAQRSTVGGASAVVVAPSEVHQRIFGLAAWNECRTFFCRGERRGGRVGIIVTRLRTCGPASRVLILASTVQSRNNCTFCACALYIPAVTILQLSALWTVGGVFRKPYGCCAHGMQSLSSPVICQTYYYAVLFFSIRFGLFSQSQAFYARKATESTVRL